MKLANEANTEFKAIPEGYESFEQFRDALFAPLLALAKQDGKRDFRIKYDPGYPNRIDVLIASPPHNWPGRKTVHGDYTDIQIQPESGTVTVCNASGYFSRGLDTITIYTHTATERTFPLTQTGWEDDPTRTPEIVYTVRNLVESIQDRIQSRTAASAPAPKRS